MKKANGLIRRIEVAGEHYNYCAAKMEIRRIYQR